jgi:flagellar export protein FliJ
MLSRREEAKERAALIKASVDRKIMEMLKEKKEAEFMAAQADLEQKEMEELATLTRARRGRDLQDPDWRDEA